MASPSEVPTVQPAMPPLSPEDGGSDEAEGCCRCGSGGVKCRAEFAAVDRSRERAGDTAGYASDGANDGAGLLGDLAWNDVPRLTDWAGPACKT